MNRRSHIILCMSRNKIFAGDDDSSSQQDLAPTTRRKSVQAFIKLCCYFYGHHDEDHPLCSTFFLLLDLFDNPRTQLPGPWDSNYWCCYYGRCARSFQGTAFPSMEHDRSRKREATQATTRVKSQTSWQGGPVPRAEGGKASAAVPRARFKVQSFRSQHRIDPRAEGGEAFAAAPRV